MVCSTDRSKAMLVVLFLRFVALCGFVVPAVLSIFSIWVVVLAVWYASSMAAHFAFCFTSCVVMLTFGRLRRLPVLLSVWLIVVGDGVGTRGGAGRLWGCLKVPPRTPGGLFYWPFWGGSLGVGLAVCSFVVYSTKRYVLSLALHCFVLVFSVFLALRLPGLGERELILVFFVRLSDLWLIGFVCFLFFLVSGKGCGLWWWHSVDFFLTYFHYHNRRNICKFDMLTYVSSIMIIEVNGPLSQF